MQSTITFNKTGYDPFIDFLKAYCILVVIFCHGFPFLNEIGYPIWGAEIPLFFLIQVFHSYKREPKPINWGMIGKRIVIPFVVIEAIVFGVMLISRGGQNVISLLKGGMAGGGLGPGSYYPWVYLQMAILIPHFRPICDYLGKWKSLCFFIFLSETIEIMCSVTNLPDSIYRIMGLRYITLIWFGWIYVKEGVVNNLVNTLFSLVGLCSIILFVYIGWGKEPWIYDTGWTTHRMPCYFWMAFALVELLHIMSKLLMKSELVKKIVSQVSSSSYEIYLIQMAFYAIIKPHNIFFISEPIFKYGLWFILAFVFSITIGISINKIERIYF